MLICPTCQGQLMTKPKGLEWIFHRTIQYTNGGHAFCQSHNKPALNHFVETVDRKCERIDTCHFFRYLPDEWLFRIYSICSLFGLLKEFLEETFGTLAITWCITNVSPACVLPCFKDVGNSILFIRFFSENSCLLPPYTCPWDGIKTGHLRASQQNTELNGKLVLCKNDFKKCFIHFKGSSSCYSDTSVIRLGHGLDMESLFSETRLRFQWEEGCLQLRDESCQWAQKTDGELRHVVQQKSPEAKYQQRVVDYSWIMANCFCGTL